MPRYDPKRIEPKWQKYWEDNKTFRTPDRGDKPKLYVLDMFPYPSGEGLHVGHPEGYTATDIVCRYQRMRGRNVLHPMGWDAFGLPAEDYARRTGTHPRDTTYKNIATFRRQLKMLGFSYDWDREFATTDETYFRWTQWIFLVLFDTWFDPECEWTDAQGDARKGRGRPIAELAIPDAVSAAGPEAVRRYQDKHRLAYQAESPVNWCPALGTVLSNEEVIGGVSERGGHPVERLPLRQWMLRITAYCERLLGGLDELDWSDAIKALQRNWIGRSEGAEVDFYIGNPSRDREGASTASDSPSDTDFQSWQQHRAASGWPAEPSDDVLRIYTTRPDTLFGATYMVLAPEHPFVDRLTTLEQRGAVDGYRKQAAAKSDLDRTDLAKEKTGVFTGSYAINPVNGERIPIWIADYVLISYGTGAIMAVPAGDLRDWEFARAFDLPIRGVVQPPDGYEPSREEAALAYEEGGERRFPFIGEGTAIQSGDYDGLPSREFKQRIATDLTDKGLGRAAVNYRLRDWLFSRQHYWGEPFPVLHELDEDGEPTGLLRTVKAEHLPVPLPEMKDFKPHGRPEPPLEEAPQDWLFVDGDDPSVADPLAGARGYGTESHGRPPGATAGLPSSTRRLKRETNTMPQWAGSCWYYLRFIDPKNADAFVDPAKERSWMPVDLYVGGAEHAVLHLLYARFWHMVLFDRGYLSTPEPFQRLVNQGIILGEVELTGYRTADGRWVTASDVSGDAESRTGQKVEAVQLSPDDVAKTGEAFVLKQAPDVRVESRAYKMSKSRGNVINPDEVVDDYGADALRLYEMFMGPLEATKPWSMQGVEGISRFLARVWRIVADEQADPPQPPLGKGGSVGVLSPSVQDVDANEEQLRVLHKTIKAVTEDIERLEFNTAISRMMEFVNFFLSQDPKPRQVIEPFVLLLSPFAPHLGEELWQLLGHENTLAYEPWPSYEEALTRESEIEVPVQINGKVRSRITIAAGATNDELERAALADPKVQANLDGKTVRKVIVVPGKLVNIVVK